MNKLFIPILLLAAFLLVGAGYYYFVQMPKDEQAEQTEQMKKAVVANQLTEDESKESSARMTLKELLLGGSQTCTYSIAMDTGGTTSGTVYISDGKVRGDFTISGGESGTYDGSMIQDGLYMYTWSSLMPQGMKIAITQEMRDGTDAGSTASGQTGLDLNQKVEYKCQPWTVDSSKFTPPSNITFSELQIPTGLQPATGSASQTNPSLCSACDDLTGEQKTTCLTALKCE